jgi:Domain of unknown function (DUF4062)
MPARREFRVFISAVSSELASYRSEVARVLRRKELEVRDQEHLRQGPATLLEQLAAYIKKCDAVFLLIGNQAGEFPSDDHASALGIVPLYEQYRKETGQTHASYTQWEFLLAKHYGKQTYVFFTGEGFIPDNPNSAADKSSQTAYRQWIDQKGEHHDFFGTNARLIEDVLVLPFPDLRHKKPNDRLDPGSRLERPNHLALNNPRFRKNRIATFCEDLASSPPDETSFIPFYGGGNLANWVSRAGIVQSTSSEFMGQSKLF